MMLLQQVLRQLIVHLAFLSTGCGHVDVCARKLSPGDAGRFSTPMMLAPSVGRASHQELRAVEAARVLSIEPEVRYASAERPLYAES